MPQTTVKILQRSFLFFYFSCCVQLTRKTISVLYRTEVSNRHQKKIINIPDPLKYEVQAYALMQPCYYWSVVDTRLLILLEIVVQRRRRFLPSASLRSGNHWRCTRYSSSTSSSVGWFSRTSRDDETRLRPTGSLPRPSRDDQDFLVGQLMS